MTPLRRIYLAGPIWATNYIGATDWYSEARRFLDDSFELLRPMRGKEFLSRRLGRIGHAPYDHALATPQAILARDHDDVRRSDIVLMNLIGCNGEKSIGCMKEAAWAYAYRKILVLVAEPGNVHEGHVMLEAEASYRVHDLEAGCEVCNALLPGAGWGSNDRLQIPGPSTVTL